MITGASAGGSRLRCRMPGQFSWIGSAERSLGPVDATTNAASITAAWRSSLGLEATRAAAAKALAASGWDVAKLQGPGMGVFTSSSTPMQQQACREGRSVSFRRQGDGWRDLCDVHSPARQHPRFGLQPVRAISSPP